MAARRRQSSRPNTPDQVPAVLLPETSAAHIAKNAENTIEYLHTHFDAAGFWAPTADLAVYLKQPLLSLHSGTGNDTSNAVWTTVLVLIHCMARLIDYHSYWMALVDQARAWLFGQPYFGVARADLVKRGCRLMGVDDVKSMLATVFAKGDTAEDADDEEMPRRGNWVEMYLDTPPFSKYFWNKVTNETRWNHPSDVAAVVDEPTPAEREAAQRAHILAAMKADRVAKALPMRIHINRKPFLPPKTESCESCVDSATAKPATVFCHACDVYYCDACCDATHMHPRKAGHSDNDFRFAACIGRRGFPYVRHHQV
ncbi:Aste57867_16259 [Aphanomyces stellatus]|uniref:Aste57867_16259 protein n=1 Tax=Aphanomyces stellatus TaxID=120398 RepID=A0A485L6X9_9STRA|nr:hypothetical protein As57867_016202 [Aphanomyces stellatus]VFT93036.1 Aste57867_16259 [Aphanomyces stellatus]